LALKLVRECCKKLFGKLLNHGKNPIITGGVAFETPDEERQVREPKKGFPR